MNVLVVPSQYPQEHDAVNAVFVREEAQATARVAGVTVLHTTFGRPAVSSSSDGPVRVVSIAVPRLPVLAEPLYLVAATLAGLVLVARRRPRVIHAQGVRPGGAVALALAALTRRPFVLSEYANPFSGYLATGPRRAVARAVVRRAAAVCVHSAFSRAQIEAAGMHGHFVSIPHTVDTGLFHPGAGERPDGAALYVGRLAPEKDAETLLRGLAAARDAGTEVTLEIVGDGSLRPALERLTCELGLGEAVHFAGEASKVEVAEAMRRASFLCLPSRTDNQPVAVLEALASGLPVLASDVGGLPELVGPYEGRLVAAGSPEAWGQALSRMATEAGSFDRTAIARAAAARFSHEAVAAQLLELYSATAP